MSRTSWEHTSTDRAALNAPWDAETIDPNLDAVVWRGGEPLSISEIQDLGDDLGADMGNDR
jgi:hypothetical protein